MKLYLILAVVLVLIVSSHQANDTATTKGSEAKGNQTDTTENAADKIETTNEADKNATEAGDEKDSTKSETKTETYADVQAKAGADCKTHMAFCFGQTSTFDDIKDKNLESLFTTDKKEACNIFDKAEKCLTTKKDKVCTAKEYDDMDTLICFSPRTAGSLLIVAMLCFLSKMLGQQ